MKKIIIFITILSLAGLVLVGVIYFKEPKPQPSFETYTNDIAGFSLEYPFGWYKNDQPHFGFVSFTSEDEEPPMGGASLGARIDIFVIPDTENLSLEEWMEWNKIQGGPEEEILNREEIEVGGKKAVKEVTASVMEAGNPISVYVAKGNYIIQINYTGREPDYSENLVNFEHLLNSFKFE